LIEWYSKTARYIQTVEAREVGPGACARTRNSSSLSVVTSMYVKH
jgi:hypothetical protein